MAKVKFYKGTRANLPTSGMIEEGAFYLCTDTGELYFGVGSSTLLLITDAIVRHGDGTNSIIPFDNPYNASGASGRNSIVFGDYLGRQSGNDILVVASGGNQNVTGNKDAVIACNGGVSIAGNESAALATSGVTVPSTLSNVLCVAGYHGTPDESETLYFNKLKSIYGDKIDSNGLTTKEGTTINSNIRTVGDIDTQYTDGQSAWNFKTLNAIASIVNEWFNNFNNKLHDWFGGVDDNVKKVSIVKKINTSIAETTIMYTIPNGYVAVPLKSRATGRLTIECSCPQLNINAYEQVECTIMWTDEAGAKNTNLSLSIGNNETANVSTAITNFVGDTGNISCQITTASTHSAFMYVYFDLLLLPKNS